MTVTRAWHWFWLILVVCMATPAAAESAYRWVDADGHVHFGDRPPAAANARPVQVRVNTYHSASIETLSPAAAARGSDQANTVVMYSASWCGVCKQAKAYFAANQIAYQEYDIETSERGRRDFEQLDGHGVPIILVAGRRMNGFSPEFFERASAR